MDLEEQLLEGVKAEEYSDIKYVTLETRGLSYGVNTADGYKQLLHKVTARFTPGELTALMGPSGAGKTTLMTALAGNTSGMIREGGVYVNDQPLSALS